MLWGVIFSYVEGRKSTDFICAALAVSFIFSSGWVKSVGALWAGLAFGIDLANNHILSTKVANILPLGGYYIALIVVTATVGALLGGLASLTGSFVRKEQLK
jgi:hypothetical protein